MDEVGVVCELAVAPGPGGRRQERGCRALLQKRAAQRRRQQQLRTTGRVSACHGDPVFSASGLRLGLRWGMVDRGGGVGYPCETVEGVE